jgi:hypothetical protein
MLQHQYDSLKTSIQDVLVQNVSQDVWAWLLERAGFSGNNMHFYRAFTWIPRKTGNGLVILSQEQKEHIESVRHGFSIERWPVDRLCRVWLLLQLNTADKEQYVTTIENLFSGAEMNELVALYAALPVLAYPEQWRRRCAEGIRSNIGSVLETIMCGNPYPCEQLDEAAWNQMVLKAFFTEKPVHRIIGLDDRANQELANILSDYAHERWAASRPVNPQLWRCVGKFINERIFPDIQRIAGSENMMEREAAALACKDSPYPPAKELFSRNSEFKSAIERGELTWDVLALGSVVNLS